LETDQAERLATASPAVAADVETAIEAQKPARRPAPEHLPREDVRLSAPCTCPNCGGALRKIGDEVTETLDYVPGRFKVIRHIRAKLSCRACDMVVAAPAPDHAIVRGGAGAGLLAHIVVSKYDDHPPEEALRILARPLPSAYSRALAALRDDTQAWWEEQLGWNAHDYEEGQTPYRADAESLGRFLEAEILPWYEKRRQELDYRPLLRTQAFGEAVDPDRLERLARYEVHLDRKLERMLAMLFKLQELRRAPNQPKSVSQNRRRRQPRSRGCVGWVSTRSSPQW
jgi:transposase